MGDGIECEKQVNTWISSICNELEDLRSINEELLTRLSPVMNSYDINENEEPIPESKLVPVANELRGISEKIHKIVVIHRNIIELLEI